MIKVGEWVLTSNGKVVENEKDGRYSFKNKKEAMEAICSGKQKITSHKMPSGQYRFSFNGALYTLTKVTESNLNRVMSMLED